MLALVARDPPRARARAWPSSGSSTSCTRFARPWTGSSPSTSGATLMEGPPDAVMASPEVQRVYLGIDVHVSLLARPRALARSTATSRRCSAISLDVAEGETVAVIGANGSRQDARFSAPLAGAVPVPPAPSSSTARGRRAARADAGRAGASCSCPRAGRSSRASRVRGEPPGRRLPRARRARGRSSASMRSSRCSPSGRRAARHQPLGRRAADARHRPRAHGQSAAPARGRDLARPGAAGGQELYERAGERQGGGHDAARRRAGREPGAGGRPARLLPPQGRGRARGRARASSSRERIAAAYFGT